MSWFTILKSSSIDVNWIMDVFHWDANKGMEGMLGMVGGATRMTKGKANKHIKEMNK